MATRYERRLKRKRSEEVMSWFVLPFVLIIGWFLFTTVWDGLREAVPSLNDLKAIQEKAKRQ